MLTLKKIATSKRTSLPRTSTYTKSFLKDWDRLSRCGRYDISRLKEVILKLISNDAPLGAEWLDHALKGHWKDYRECHIGGDFLLIYQLEETMKNESIVFVRAGTHADLFEN